LATCGTLGTIVATTPSQSTGSVQQLVLGNVLMVVGVFFASLYNIQSHRQLITGRLTTIAPLQLLALHQLSAIAFILLVWFIRLLLGQPFGGGINLVDCSLALVCGITQFALPFWMYLEAIKNMGAARTSIFLCLPPIFTLGAAYIFLGEKLTFWQCLGALLAIASVGALSLLKNDHD